MRERETDIQTDKDRQTDKVRQTDRQTETEKQRQCLTISLARMYISCLTFFYEHIILIACPIH